MAAGLLVVGVGAVCVVAHTQWVRDAKARFDVRAASAQAAADKAAKKDEAETAERRRAAEKDYRGKRRLPRTGTTGITVTSNGLAVGYGAEWNIAVTHRLSLRSADRMAGDLRRGTQRLLDWLPFEVSVVHGDIGCGPETLGDDSDEDNRVSQKKSAVGVAVRQETSGSAVDDICRLGKGPYSSLVIELQADERLLGKRDLYDSWTVHLRARGYRITALDGGRVVEQAADRAEFAAPASGRVRISLDRTDAEVREVGDARIFAGALQSEQDPWREGSALGLALFFVAMLLVRPALDSWAPAATARRWETAGGLAVLITGALLAWALWGTDTDLNVQALVAWWWVVLPFLVAVWAVRAGTGRPPRPRRLALLVLPGAGLLAPVAALLVSGGGGAALTQLVAVAGASGSVGLLLRGGLLGPVGRRWALPAAAAVAVAVAAVGAGTGLPVRTGPFVTGADPAAVWQFADTLASASLAWFWPAVVLVGLGALGLGDRVSAQAAVIAWLLLLLGDGDLLYYWFRFSDGSWYATGIYTEVAVNRPLTVVLPAAVGLALVLLVRDGAKARALPPHARTAGLVLGVAALGTVVVERRLVPFTYPSGEGTGVYFALAVATFGFAWLLPLAAQDAAERRQLTTSVEHTRAVHRLLKHQTLDAGRRTFLTGSHTKLADGDLSSRAWSVRWRELGGRSDGGKSPHQRWQVLRSVALGSSGGRPAWRNGVAAATLLAVLSLPWSAYTLAPKVVEISGGEFTKAVAVWSTPLRWPLYGFLYGYFYSWLRGGTPLGKAMCLLAVVLPAELTALLHQGKDPGEFAITLLLTTGDCLAVFLVLGLYWEARQVRAAGLRWGQIRNFRSLSTLAVPATTVVVAAATALATALVGFWAVPDQSQEQPPAPPSVSGTPSPAQGDH
ncbi:hypothetical protein [Streptomyces longispororuber]|uniref:hypothetical protein n=1 Tax=Streptomyces longispororuber TaxID=68230 RepID=UPI0021096E0D|nr:hypothetical protein [Streptomyces longispororuber]MCQ4208305.1 hypothetical protein [Streptomyces longispororuber]